jgi:hypothetical protein
VPAIAAGVYADKFSPDTSRIINPKSKTFTRPSGVIFTLAGFKSR